MTKTTTSCPPKRVAAFAVELEAKLNNVQTLDVGESPTPTADMARPDTGLAPPDGDPYGPVSTPPTDTIFGMPKKAVLIGGAAIAALLLLKG